MFHYHEIVHNESCVLIAEFESGNYRMSYQFMYQDNRMMVSFAQNQVPHHNILEEMRVWLEPLFEWHRVMNVARNSLTNCCHMHELHYIENH